MRGNFKISTYGHDFCIEGDPMSDWLSRFAEQLEKGEKTAVEVARERMSQISINDQISAIMNGSHSRFSSVEDAVKFYQSETGLSDYLRTVQAEQLEAAATLVKSAEDTYDLPEYLEPEEVDSDSNDPESIGIELVGLGVDDTDVTNIIDEFDLKKFNELVNRARDAVDEDSVDLLNSLLLKFKKALQGESTEDVWEEEDLGFVSDASPKAHSRVQELVRLALDAGVNEKKIEELVEPKEKSQEGLIDSLNKLFRKLDLEDDKDEANVDQEIEDLIDSDKDDSEDPVLIINHPQIRVFIDNITKTPGIHVPAIIRTIQELFSRDISTSDLDDKKLLKYIDNKCTRPKGDEYISNLGLDLGTQRDFVDEQNNRNPFGFAMPARII